MISRAEIVACLTQWQAGEKAELEVWRWAEDAVENLKAHGSGGDELIRDLVDTLAALPFDMITLEDVPVFLDALANPVEEADLSVNLLWNHIDGIDTDGRRHAMQDHPFYGQFCDGMN